MSYGENMPLQFTHCVNFDYANVLDMDEFENASNHCLSKEFYDWMFERFGWSMECAYDGDDVRWHWSIEAPFNEMSQVVVYLKSEHDAALVKLFFG